MVYGVFDVVFIIVFVVYLLVADAWWVVVYLVMIRGCYVFVCCCLAVFICVLGLLGCFVCFICVLFCY